MEKSRRWRNQEAVDAELKAVRSAFTTFSSSDDLLDERIVAALEAGATFREVAEVAGMSSSSVHYRATRFKGRAA